VYFSEPFGEARRVAARHVPDGADRRLDRDTVRGNEDFERGSTRSTQGQLDLLVGTQMIAKGHDVHGVTLVGVVGAISRWVCPIFVRLSEPSNCLSR